MPRFLFSQNAQQRGLLLIGFGLCALLAAQLFPVIPVAAAMMLIGCGATQLLASGTLRSLPLLAIHLMVYTTLIGLAIAAQSHTASSGPARSISWMLWADHGVAVLLLLVTIKWLMERISSPTVFD